MGPTPMTAVHMRRTAGLRDTQRGKRHMKRQCHTGRRPCEDRGRNWREDTTCQGLLAPTGSEKRSKNPFLELSEET